MSRIIGVVGKSGSGKSTSLRTLDPEETYVINVLDKPLPFHGSNKLYNKDSKNYFSSEKYSDIITVLKAIDANRPEVKTVIIDDVGFVMQTEFFARSNEKGYDKFSDIGQHMFLILNTIKNMRDDVNVILMFHTEEVFSGQVIVDTKIKTIGRMLDDKYEPRALMGICLYTNVTDENGSLEYQFITNKQGILPAKSPLGMFDEIAIPNDMNYVINKINEYYG